MQGTTETQDQFGTMIGCFFEVIMSEVQIMLVSISDTSNDKTVKIEYPSHSIRSVTRGEILLLQCVAIHKVVWECTSDESIR